MEKKIDFNDQFNRHTVFIQSEETVWLSYLCGLACGLSDTDAGYKGMLGLLALESDEARFTTKIR